MFTREAYEQLEKNILSPLAQKSGLSHGRVYPEPEHPYRSAFQRDRDRVLHSRAFRRLMYKTQVFINHEGDHYRTRYSHTMEVSQIARNIARTMRINEDLAEAIALAHDVGHAPFGHTGEKTLNNLLASQGGFEHNRQSLRVIQEIEKKYPGFDGLNLTWEVREGIIMHSTSYDHPEKQSYVSGTSPSLEAQVVDLSDQIAYDTHDIDDGLASGIITQDELLSLEIWQRVHNQIKKEFTITDEEIRRYYSVRSLIDLLVSDALKTTDGAIASSGVSTPEDVLHFPEKLVKNSDEICELIAELESFLLSRMYNHPKIKGIARMTDRIVTDLFNAYSQNVKLLPESTQTKFTRFPIPQVIGDYLAGMTDRFAITEHERLIGKTYKQLQFDCFP